ncbi:cytochrome P450 [Macrophomina phaseolina]|uniref:Cytochrome P450 n=1 Tax=Macrophomina phaseolina TaxID=35725 RepID=A0ABQ8G8A1_9PEZI|nr:cytochrome P450 [Macrophomina phaseolina]
MAMSSLVQLCDSSTSLALASGCILVAIFLFLRNRAPKLNFPVVGDPAATDCRDALEEGTRLYPDTPWLLPLQDPMVILPAWAAAEIKSLPENQASLNKELYIRFLGRYTMMGQDDDEMVAVIKHDLTRSLPDVVDGLIDEARYAIQANLGKCTGWTPSSVFEKMARIVTMINGRAFVGLPLSRDDDWINSTIAYTSEGEIVASSLRPFPALIRPLVAPFLPAVRNLRKNQALVAARTRPLINAHFSAAATPGDEKQDLSRSGRLLTWLLGRYKHQPSPSEITRDYLLSCTASIPIPAGLLTHLLYELASRPEYLQPLRDELAAAMETTKRFDFTFLSRLDKMDSFIRETQRLNSHGLVMMTRRTTSAIKLSDGSVIPKGVSIGVSNHTLNRSPEHYPQPDEFQGFRFYELRQRSEENARKYQFASTSLENLNWGYGTHACPGRYFASALVKLVLALVLSNYDVELSEGKKPENMVFGVMVIPNPFAQLQFKSRTPLPGLELQE